MPWKEFSVHFHLNMLQVQSLLNVVTAYSQRGPGLEQFVGVQYPLVVGAQQRADALPGREAKSIGHFGPLLLFANGLEAAF